MHELRTFDQILASADDGDFLSKLLEDHQNLIVELQEKQLEFGGKISGSLTLKINYQLDHNKTIKMVVTADIKTPKAPSASAILWTTPDGFTTHINPNQSKMDFNLENNIVGGFAASGENK